MPSNREMPVRVTPSYKRRLELPYCCVPAILQMVFERRQMPVPEQELIGNELGLIVPEDATHHFSWVRTGTKPQAGWGTQTRSEEFSIQRYFDRHNVPLQLFRYRAANIATLNGFLMDHLNQDDDVVVCIDQRKLTEGGDEEHVALVQGVDGDSVQLVNPAENSQDTHMVSLSQLAGVLIEVWIISQKPSPGI